jgi:membrane protease YdiL (CAAX protease family)
VPEPESLPLVLPRKDWPTELVFLLFFRLLLGVAVALSLLAALSKAIGGKMPSVLELFLGGLAFHGTGLAVIQLFLRNVRQSWGAAFGWVTQPGSAVRLGVGVALVVLPVTYGLQAGCAWLLEQVGVAATTQRSVELLVNDPSVMSRGLIAAFAVGLAPLVEETLFRGLLFPTVRDLGWPRAALWGQAVLFGAIHANAAAFLPLTLFGATLAWLYVRTGNLLAPIAAHAVFNLAPFVLLALGVEFGP